MLVVLLTLGCVKDAGDTGRGDPDAAAKDMANGKPATSDTGWRGVGPACEVGPLPGGRVDAGATIDGAAVPWDWVGIVGTGQSLAVGQDGNPVASRTQPYRNLKLSIGTLAWPVDPDDAQLTLAPNVGGCCATPTPSSERERKRRSPTTPSPSSCLCPDPQNP
jgi:hypothetical protein